MSSNTSPVSASSAFSAPVPALPVHSTSEAVAYYCDVLGFTPAWENADARMAAVSFGEVAIFFREVEGEIAPAEFWVFAEDIEASYAAFVARGADIVAPLETKPWGLKQFTLRDLHGNMYHVHHDV